MRETKISIKSESGEVLMKIGDQDNYMNPDLAERVGWKIIEESENVRR